MMTVSIAFASIPAAARFCWYWPWVVFGLASAAPYPVSMAISLEPVLTTIGLKTSVIESLGRCAASSAALTSSFLTLFTTAGAAARAGATIAPRRATAAAAVPASIVRRVNVVIGFSLKQRVHPGRYCCGNGHLGAFFLPRVFSWLHDGAV